MSLQRKRGWWGNTWARERHGYPQSLRNEEGFRNKLKSEPRDDIEIIHLPGINLIYLYATLVALSNL